MKKILVALLLLCALTACGNEEENTNTFTVGMECAYAPFNYQLANASETSVAIEGGYCDGYDVMIAQRIADSLGKELVVKKIAWGGLPVALEADDIDAIIAGMTANAEREEGIDFTSPYYDSKAMIMIVRADSEEAGFTSIQEFSGKKVIGQLNTNYDSVIDQIEGVDHVTPKATYPEMVVALQNEDVDGITAEMAVAQGVVSSNPDLAIVHFTEGQGFEADTTVSIGLKEGTRGTDFYNAVENALNSITEEDRAALMVLATENQPAGE